MITNTLEISKSFKTNEIEIRLKVKLQETYKKQGYSEDEVREMMGGKLYEM